MSVGFVRPKVSQLMFLVYGRPLHPELFDIVRDQQIHRDDYQANISITDSCHLVRWQRESVCVTELVSRVDSPLPQKRRLLACRLRGERTETIQCAPSVVYQTSIGVERLEPAYQQGQREAGPNVLASQHPHGPAALRVSQERRGLPAQSRNVFRREEPARLPVTNDLWHGTRMGCHNRHPAGQSLRENEPEPLVTRRQHEYVGRSQNVRNVVADAQEPDDLAEAESVRQLLVLAALRALPDDDQSPVAGPSGELGDSAEKRHVVFDRGQVGDATNTEAAIVKIQRLADPAPRGGIRSEKVRIDSVVDDSHPS